ncbi:uncharacterized protein LOC123682471 isoform X2 [Harmonia axyridis]|uniref:uncharacterized protein LOC123682471 isoform X2 n=1 Tax=Harmonia axyridis TaxID=115357 RepID=UPI001E276BAC|nr:uncharacterized protein LOC123682471 isoform X2 [Harmonia axyridis]
MKVFSILLILLLAYIAVSDASPSPQSPGIDDITSFGRDKRDVIGEKFKEVTNHVSNIERHFKGKAIEFIKHFSDLLMGVSRKTVDKLKESFRKGDIKGGFCILWEIMGTIFKNKFSKSERGEPTQSEQTIKQPAIFSRY